MASSLGDDADAPFARWMTMLAHHRRGDEASSSSDSDESEPRAARVVDFASCAFIDVPMVGTHDSATHGICDSSDFAPDAPRGLGRLPRALVPLVRRIVAQWSKTQSMGILQQLRAGVRYFDIRLVPRRCVTSGLEELWVSHGSFSVPFASVVHEVAIFYSGVLSGDPDAVASNLETIVFDVQRVTAFTAAHTAMFVQAMAPLQALLCDDRWHVSTPLRDVWDARADAPIADAAPPAAVSSPSQSVRPCGGSDRWSIDSWSREVSASQQLGAGQGLGPTSLAAVEPPAALQPVAASDGVSSPPREAPSQRHQRLASLTSSEHPQSPAWAMSPNNSEFCRSGVAMAGIGQPESLAEPDSVGADEAGTPSRRLYTSGPAPLDDSAVTGRSHSRVASETAQLREFPALERAIPAAAAPDARDRDGRRRDRNAAAGGVSQRRIFVLYPAAAIAQSAALLTPEERASLHDRHTMAIRSLWFNQQEVNPLMGMLRRELVMSGAAPCERSATLHALQAVLTPTPRDIAWSVVVTLPVRSIQDYAEQLNTKVLALWDGFGRVSRWAPRGETLAVASAAVASQNSHGVPGHEVQQQQEPSQQDSVVLRDRRNVLLMDFFEVGRAPNGATAVELCFQDAITRFLPEVRTPTPAHARGLASGCCPGSAARLLRLLARRARGAVGFSGSSLSVDVAPVTAVPLLIAPPPETHEGVVALAPNASPVLGVAQPFNALDAPTTQVVNGDNGKPSARPARNGDPPLSPVGGFTANHHRAHAAPDDALRRDGSPSIARRFWGGTTATLRWMVGAGSIGSGAQTASPPPPPPTW